MKRLFALLLIGVIILGLAACAARSAGLPQTESPVLSDVTATPSDTPAPTPKATPTPTPKATPTPMPTPTPIPTPTPAPTPEPTLAPLPTPEPPAPVATYVWIPKSGSKYHSTASCSNMKNPSQITLESAISRGYGQCSKCW